MNSDSSRDGRELREIAKLAAAQPSKPGARKPNADHSGLVDLAALMAEHPTWLDDAVSRAKSSAGLPPPSFAPGSLAPAAIETYAGDDLPRGVPVKRSIALALASTIAGVMVVGACAFAWHMKQHAPVAAVAQPATVAAAAAAPRVDEPAAAPAPAATELAQAAPAANVPVAAPTPVPIPPVPAAPAAAAAAEPASDTQDSEPATTAHGKKHGHGHHAALAMKSDPDPTPAPAAAPAPPPPAPAGHPPSHVVATGSALDMAMKAASAGPSPIPAPSPAPAAAPAPKAERAVAANDGRPQRPSGSAVTSALTSALPGARACMPDGMGASRTLVTFGSEGNVQRVDVSGPAGGDAKVGSCLKRAFNKAHVPAFADATYSAAVNVRPD